MLCFFLALIFILFSETCRAQDHFPAGARSMALSHASVSFSDSWSSFHNQAGIVGSRSISAAFFFESRYGLDELSLVAGALTVPAGNGAFAGNLFQFGSGNYRISRYALAYAHRLTPKLNGGLQLDYYSRRIAENERVSGFATFEAGLLYLPNRILCFGVHVFNPVQGGYRSTSETEKLPFVIRSGMHYCFDDEVLVAAEIQKDSARPVLFKMGVEFSPVEDLSVRLGVSVKPVRYTAGFGYRYRSLSADLGFGFHGTLGITPALSIQFAL